MLKKVAAVSVLVIIVMAMIPIIETVQNSNDTPIGNNDPDHSELCVFALAGQSQAAYRSVDLTVAQENPAVKPNQAWYYGTSSAPVYYSSDWASWDLSGYGIYSMTDDEGKWRVGSLEAPFASKFINSTGKDCLIINTAISGRNIHSFVEGNPGWDYTKMIMDDALSKLPNTYEKITYSAVIWLHGQADLLASKEYYVEEFGKVYHQYGTDYNLNTWLIEQPRASEAPTIDIANEIICDTYPNCYIASTFGTNNIVNGGPYLYDGTHYNQLGRNIVGTEMAAYYVDHVDRSLAWIPNEQLSLIGVIPIMLILLPVMYAVKTMVLRRD